MSNKYMRAAYYASISEPASIATQIASGMVRAGIMEKGDNIDDTTAYPAMMVGRYYGELLQKNGFGTPRVHWDEELRSVKAKEKGGGSHE